MIKVLVLLRKLAVETLIDLNPFLLQDTSWRFNRFLLILAFFTINSLSLDHVINCIAKSKFFYLRFLIYYLSIEQSVFSNQKQKMSCWLENCCLCGFRIRVYAIMSVCSYAYLNMYPHIYVWNHIQLLFVSFSRKYHLSTSCCSLIR